MKKTFIVIFVIALFTSTLYVGAKTISPDSYSVVPTSGTKLQQFYRQRVAPQFNHYYITQEQHDLIIEKRVELTNAYLLNYENMTQTEKEEALTNFTNDLKAYMNELLGYEVNNPNMFGNRMLSRLTPEEKDLAISKQVELTIKYYSNYSNLTDEEKLVAQQNFNTDMREYMQTFMIDHNMGYGMHRRFGRR